ncbi:MAG: ATP cone domain-containing protein, partial [Peptostreptococcaceae bacterium]
RNGTVEEFDLNKIARAIRKSMIDAGKENPEITDESFKESLNENSVNIALQVSNNINEKNIDNVEAIQDEVENVLMDKGYKKAAKAFILYRNKRTEIRNRPWELNELQRSILNKKYLQPGETFDAWIERVSNGNNKLAKLIRDKKFLFAGRILSNRGIQNKGIAVTYSNCYVVEPPSDSIEGIYEAAYKLARTFSYGGGVGIDVSKLRPKNSKVHNAAKTTSGAVSFMELFGMTTSIIGQKGRRG